MFSNWSKKDITRRLRDEGRAYLAGDDRIDAVWDSIARELPLRVDEGSSVTGEQLPEYKDQPARSTDQT